ncbi:hypothetical protein Q9233_004657 [Columba guinea]|nr:hypothetical protein Q9233_004657 [Columba guinea]
MMPIAPFLIYRVRALFDMVQTIHIGVGSDMRGKVTLVTLAEQWARFHHSFLLVLLCAVLLIHIYLEGTAGLYIWHLRG